MALFENLSLRDFVEPIKGVFVVQGGNAERAIRQTITTVAVANMVMAGLPGKLGVGVFVSMALEGWMAWVIATRVGISLGRVSDIWANFGLLAGVVLTIVWLFKALLGLAFALFSVIPGINPLIFAELLVTNLVGVLFWVSFKEGHHHRQFQCAHARGGDLGGDPGAVRLSVGHHPPQPVLGETTTDGPAPVGLAVG